MKDLLRFFKTISLVVVISFVLCTLFTYSTFLLNINTKGKEEMRIPKECRTIIIGNSMAQCAFNDTILNTWRNIAKWQQYYLDLAPALDLTLKINSHIDTVLLATGLPSFYYFDDSAYKERSYSELTFFGKKILLDYDLIKLNLKHNPNFISFLLTNGVENLTEMPQINGEYIPTEGHALMYDKAGGIKECERILTGKGTLSYTKEEIESEHKYQILGLKNLISTCRNRNVECILVNTPLRNINHYISDYGYRRLLASIGDSLLIADYTCFQFPDTSYYRDDNHLNYKGSVYFSEFLKRNGLQTQYVVDYAAMANEE